MNNIKMSFKKIRAISNSCYRDSCLFFDVFVCCLSIWPLNNTSLHNTYKKQTWIPFNLNSRLFTYIRQHHTYIHIKQQTWIFINMSCVRDNIKLMLMGVKVRIMINIYSFWNLGFEKKSQRFEKNPKKKSTILKNKILWGYRWI